MIPIDHARRGHGFVVLSVYPPRRRRLARTLLWITTRSVVVLGAIALCAGAVLVFNGLEYILR